MMNLIFEAKQAQKRAYAPYSNYQVGAAVRGEGQQIFSGCNVENVSFGLSVCAERVALFNMVAGGNQTFEEIVVVTKDGNFPCGACLQVMSEFTGPGNDPKIYLVNSETDEIKSFMLSQLLPFGFFSEL